MAETMTALVERNRAHLAAYSAASKIEGWDSKAEDAFLSSADLAAANTIENDPPRLRDKADLVAAVSYIAEDKDFLQEGHGRVMARVLEYLTTPETSATSQRANALFGFYVATEREQVRLAALGETAAEAALSAKALEARDALLALRDRTACPDLIGARILLDLMLRHYWHGPDAPAWDEDDRAEALPMLEILSDRLTGEVRRQAAIALGTVGVEVAPEAAVESIESMALRLRALYDRDHTEETEAEFDAQYARFLELQTRIIHAAPVTPRDVALQYFADNHFGASDTSNEFDDVLRTLSGMEWP